MLWQPPTIYGGFMQGIGVGLVIVISNKHSSVSMPVVPQHSCDGGREVWELKGGICCLDWMERDTHTHTKISCFGHGQISQVVCAYSQSETLALTW